jgi:serine/threonine protein kinase
MMTVTNGTKLGRYEVLSPLGAGGMGEVYLAQDTKLDRKIALKVLPANVASNRDRMERFIREAKSAAALNHPNIAHIYEIGEADGVNFIAMEFIDGHTLRELIHGRQTDLKKLLRYLQHAAEGLSKAHAAGIVHRDLKPDNIMITRDGHAKILDFGLAKLVERQLTESNSDDREDVATAIMQQHSTPGTIIGTVGYMSPEQAQGKTKEIDQRSDIFSFGCMLFEAATGKKPFEGDSVVKSLHKIIYEPAPALKDFNPSAPADLHRIVRRCLAKDPEDRYQTIKDVAIELRDLRREMESATGLEISAPPSSSDSVVSSGAPSVSPAELSSLESQPAISTGTQLETQTAEGRAGQPTATSAAQLTQFNRRKRITIFVVAALLVVAGLSFGLYAFFSWNRTTPFLKMKVNRITSTGKASSAAISPDGRYIVHAVDNAGRQSLELRQVATNTNQEIIPPSEVTYSGLMFSQDGNYIYYGMRDKTSPSASLYRKPVLGGEATKLITNLTGRISLSPDGKRLAFLRSDRSVGETAVILANEDGSGEQKIASRQMPDFYLELAWSPDAKVIALATGTFKGNFHGTVVAVPVAGGEEKPLTPQTWVLTGSVAWLPDGRGLILSAVEQSFGVGQLWYVSYPGGEVRQVTNDLNNYDVVSITSDSKFLVTVQSEQSSNIWVAPTSTTGDVFAVDVGRARQITSGSSKFDGYYGLAWTSDGRITYTSAASGNHDIWVMQPDGSDPKQLTSETQGSVYQTDIFQSLSPDGRYVFFTSDRVTGNPHVWRMDIDGSNLKQVTNGIAEGVPHVTPDGKSVVYTDFSVRGLGAIRKVSIDGGNSTQLTDKPADRAAISPDGKYIACGYQAEPNSARKIAVISIDGGAPVKLFEVSPTASVRPLSWSSDGRSLIYVDTSGGVSNLWAQPLEGGKPVQLTDFKSDRIYSFDFSRDGRQLALTRGNESTDVVLFSNLK